MGRIQGSEHQKETIEFIEHRVRNSIPFQYWIDGWMQMQLFIVVDNS